MLNNADNDLIAKIKAIKEFQVQTSALASCLHIPEQDAEQDLLIELLDHRCSDWSYSRIDDAINQRDHYFLSIVYWCRRDVARQFYQHQQREEETAQELQLLGIGDSDNSNQQQLPSSSAISAAFSEPTAAWVISVLTQGQCETQVKFGQTDRQFKQKLRRTLKFIASHPEKFSKIRLEHKQQLMEENINE